MQVCCIAETICLEESHLMYVWIARMLANMEPRYNLSFLDLIFGDQGLTHKILVDLDIATTCILHCDYCHQIHEVWPHTFGTHLFKKSRGHLDQMLLGINEEWELLYSSAKTFLFHDAKKFSALEAIYKNPSYFAGWFLKTIKSFSSWFCSCQTKPFQSGNLSRFGCKYCHLKAIGMPETSHFQKTKEGYPGHCRNPQL
jgi:hypothetical protein